MIPSPTALYTEIISDAESSQTKVCSRCRFPKPLRDFSKYARKRDGLQSYCKKCMSELEVEYVEKREAYKKECRRLEFYSMPMDVRPQPKICSNPNCLLSGIVQPPENFHKSKIHRTGLMADCVECERERKRKSARLHRKETSDKAREKYNSDPEVKAARKRWYEENKDQLNKMTKEWREANKEATRRLHIERRFRNYGVTQEWYDTTLAAQGGGCAICGSKDPKSNGDTFHVDHYHGCCSKGCHACDNCRRGLLCGVCNTRLGILEMSDWSKQAKAYLAKFKREDAAGNDQPSLFDGL